MIFYQGKGGLIFYLPLLIFVLNSLVFHLSFNFFLGVVIIVELIIAYISYKDHQNNPLKHINKQTGEEMLIERKNTIYWIKAEYWGIFIAIFGLWMLWSTVFRTN